MQPLCPTLVLLLAPGLTAQSFVEDAAGVGLDHRFLSGLDRIGMLPNMHDWVQVGMAPADVDGDGDLDLVTLGRVAPNHLWLFEAGSFFDATPGSGLLSAELDTCCSFADWDRDGDLDLAVGVYDRGELALPGKGRLLENDGLGVFEDVTVRSGALGSGHTLSIQMVDVDLDGWVDMHLSEFGGTPNQLWYNLGAGSFRERSMEVGAAIGGSTHVAGVLDTDGDGRVEIHVGNDWPVTSSAGMGSLLGEVLLSGQPDGSFSDVTPGSGLDEPISTMAIAWGDVDYDGDPDAYKTQVGSQYLVINDGWPHSGKHWFRAEWEYQVAVPYIMNPADPYGLDFGQTVGWGAHFTALDRDPWVDLVMVCGHVEPQASDKLQRNFLFKGSGPATDHVMRDWTEAVGFLDHVDDRSLCCADFDADGDVDLLIGPPGGSLRYFRNATSDEQGGTLVVVPHGRTSAPQAVGARVRWYDTKHELLHARWPGAEANTAGQNERAAFFGLGSATAVDVGVDFPSGVSIELPQVPAGSRLDVFEPRLFRLSAPQGVLSPGDALVVRAFAHDSSGTPLDSGAEVGLAVPGLTPLGPVVSLGANVFQRSFRAEAPGEYRVNAIFEGFRVLVRPRVTVRGAPSVAQTTSRLVPEAVRAASTDTARFEVAPRDVNGLPLGAGHSLAASLGGGPSQAMLDLGDGRYTTNFPAPSTPDMHAVEVYLDGASLGVLATLEVAGAPHAASSDLYHETPAHWVAMNPHMWFGLLTPRDTQQRRLGPGADVSLQIMLHPGSVGVSPFIAPIGQDDGEFVFVLQRELSSHANSASGVLRVWADGVLVSQTDFTF